MLENIQLDRLERLWDRKDERQRMKELLQGADDDYESSVEWASVKLEQEYSDWTKERGQTLMPGSRHLPAFATPFAVKANSLRLADSSTLLLGLCDTCRPLIALGFGEPTVLHRRAKCDLCQLMRNFGERPRRLRIMRRETYFMLLQRWLRDCDDNHKDHSHHFTMDPPLPTRVLDVRNRDGLRLCHMSGKVGRYIALTLLGAN